jgi:hypothetical protein
LLIREKVISNKEEEQGILKFELNPSKRYLPKERALCCERGYG